MNYLGIFIGISLTLTFNNVLTDPIGTGGPSVVFETKDALLTCVVMGPHTNDTVIWKKGNEVLTAGMNRVTSDKRFRILHDDEPAGKIPSGGDVWVLLILKANLNDTDMYTCEVNSNPIVRSFHPLKVKPLPTLSSSLTPPSLPSSSILPISIDRMDRMFPTTTIGSTYDFIPETTPMFTHDFTYCCESLNVSIKCIGFCNVHNILDGTTGIEPELCEDDFPSIVKCMADGRNHLPCCQHKKIPDICQDMCLGEYNPFTDYVKSRVSCIAHTLPALMCILDGIQKIPSEPQNIFVEPLNEKSLQVNWSPPEQLADTVKSYTINVTILHSFDQDSLSNMTISEINIKVSKDINMHIVNDLKPFTMYSVTVTANNDYGSSLPSFRVRALTLDSNIGTQTSVAVVPALPDVRGCCMKHGMTHRTCLDRMCDPKKADFTEVPDLMVCAPWANITFSCLANNIDHTPCCMARGIPSTCLSFCTGNVSTVTFALFKCLQYMSEYSSCLLQGYGVLPGPPSRVKAPLVSAHFAVIEWNQPKILADTVTNYHVNLRKLSSGEEYSVIHNDRPPIVLENLEAGVYYEAFIIAVNAHGKGGPSPRLVFQTKHELEIDPITPVYNLTSCCHASGLLPQCMPLCTYDMKMSDIKALSQICLPQMGALAKCAAGQRDHTPCCNRRGVPKSCISLCRGVIPHPPYDCLSYGGNIIQCFEEGTGNIPGPVEDLRVIHITNTSISLAWAASETDENRTDLKTIEFIVQYGKVNNMTMYETVIKLENEIETNDTDIVLTNLESQSIYRIMVVARNIHGSSLPSSMLLINTSSQVDFQSSSSSIIYGAPSPPHSLTISAHSATWVNIAWQPPEFSHPHETISYIVYFKSTSADKFTIIETKLLWARLNNLKPNSQHVVYVQAIGVKGTSLPSETLVAWTDPALPAFVDPPSILPSDIIQEGGSMTVLCLALGNPAPTISLYVGGHLVRQDTSRHMVTIIHNITTDMEHVSCYADNGYGIPMQASKRVNISFTPRIQVSGISIGLLGQNTDLKCMVRAKPPAKIIFWRDHEGRVPVINGNDYEMSMDTSNEDPTLATMILTIKNLTNDKIGDYFCHAENPLGSSTRAVSIRMRNTAPVHNVTECCMKQNVSSPCMDACSFYVDIDAVKDRPECIVDFEKLMICAADGSDYRSCCANGGVSRSCLNWCRGESVQGMHGECILQYTTTIVHCFQSHRDRLPSPPTNVVVQIQSDGQVQITWEPPLRNAHLVEGYRLYWHEVEMLSGDGGSEMLNNKLNGIGGYRMDTKDLHAKIYDLLPNIVYELNVKASNLYGSSLLSPPIRFTLGDNHITSASSNTNATGTICGILAGILAIVLAIAAILFYKRRKTIKSANGVAFENPSYLREVNMEHVQISAVSEPANDWRQERLQTVASTTNIDQQNSVVPMATEVNPTLYEELKLGHEGAGFKRLV